MNGQNRNDIYPGLEVDIILKKDQRSGKKTRGIVKGPANQFCLPFARDKSEIGRRAGWPCCRNN